MGDTDNKNIHAGWVLFALAIGGFAIGTTEFATMSLLPLFAHGLGIDAPTAGHVISAYALGVVVGAPIIAVLGARVPRRTLLVVLMGVFALANGLSALAPNYGWMLVFRFLSGLPHGAYFGVAALVATSLVPENRRTVAVGRVFLGLTCATIVGVPMANWLGQAIGWRWSFGLVALLGVLTVTCVWWLAPNEPAHPESSPLRELGALKRAQVWLTLGVGAVGFGGMFAVYTYLADVLGLVTGVPVQAIPIVLSVFGVGWTIGNVLVPVFADRALMRTAGMLLLWSAVSLAIFPFVASNIWTLTVDVFLIGIGGSLGTVLQTRLMDVAEDAQGLAAALNHSAFNTANALGPFLGGLAISAGYGWTSAGWVGSLLAMGGLLLCFVSIVVQRSRAASGSAIPENLSAVTADSRTLPVLRRVRRLQSRRRNPAPIPMRSTRQCERRHQRILDVAQMGHCQDCRNQTAGQCGDHEVSGDITVSNVYDAAHEARLCKTAEPEEGDTKATEAGL